MTSSLTLENGLLGLDVGGDKIFLQVIKYKYITATLDSKQHGNLDRINFFQLHHPHSGVSRDKISQELQLMRFTLFSGNTYKLQVYIVKIAAV